MNATAEEPTIKPEAFQDQPINFPKTQVNGALLKPITQVLLDRRATPHFKPDQVPEEYLEAILSFAAQAPSGYNLQPWRFIVVRDAENRARLQKAAMNQSKISEAPVVVIAFAVKGEWKARMDAIFKENARRGASDSGITELQEAAATKFLDAIPPAIWLTRQTMIAVTTMMLVAEAYGLDTAPMEGFDADAVKREFSLPLESEVIALLAIGFGKEPDKAYGGRLPLKETVSKEHYGWPWSPHKNTDDVTAR